MTVSERQQFAQGVVKWKVRRRQERWDRDQHAVPVEPDYTARQVKRRVVNPFDGPAQVCATIYPKGLGLWMPNTGRDVNYVNARLWARFIVAETAAKVGSPDRLWRIQTTRVWPTPGNGTSRHMETVQFSPHTFEATLDEGEAMTVWVGLTCEIDASGARSDVGKVPTVKHWHGGQIVWTANRKL